MTFSFSWDKVSEYMYLDGHESICELFQNLWVYVCLYVVVFYHGSLDFRWKYLYYYRILYVDHDLRKNFVGPVSGTFCIFGETIAHLI